LILPILHPLISFDEACGSVKQPSLLFWEEEKSVSLKTNLQNPPFKRTAELNLFVGPKAVSPESEKELAETATVSLIASLGHRIFRANCWFWWRLALYYMERGEMG